MLQVFYVFFYFVIIWTKELYGVLHINIYGIVIIARWKPEMKIDKRSSLTPLA